MNYVRTIRHLITECRRLLTRIRDLEAQLATAQAGPKIDWWPQPQPAQPAPIWVYDPAAQPTYTGDKIIIHPSPHTNDRGDYVGDVIPDPTTYTCDTIPGT